MRPSIFNTLKWKTDHEVVFSCEGVAPCDFWCTKPNLVWQGDKWICRCTEQPADIDSDTGQQTNHITDRHLKCLLDNYGVPGGLLPLDGIRYMSPLALQSLADQINILGGEEKLRAILVDLNNAGYNIKRYLGGGGWGIVFEGHRVLDSKRFALKIMKPPYTDEWRKQFIREIAILRTLASKQNVVSLEDDPFELGKMLCLPIRFVEGRPLSDLILPCAPHHSLMLIDKTLSALSPVHEKQIMHRDLHLGNIMLSPDDDVSILDFGLARQSTVSLDSNTFHPVGTMSHCAPEKWINPSGCGPASDIYSIGVMLYRMLTGQYPFWANTLIGLYELIKKGTYIEPSWHSRDIPQSCDIILKAMLAIDPRDRLSDATKAHELIVHARILAELQAVQRAGFRKNAHYDLFSMKTVKCQGCGRDVDVSITETGSESEHATAICKYCGWHDSALI